MYNDNLHQPVAFHISLLLIASCFHPFITLFFCQKHLPSEHVLKQRGAFSPLEEGVKYLPKSHILLFFVAKCNKNVEFCLFSFRYYEGKDYLYSWNIDVGLLSFMLLISRAVW